MRTIIDPSALTSGSITSVDGSRIGFRSIGNGPAMVILHGSMSSGFHHAELAQSLADGHTVYLPDRRGRGLSAESAGPSTVRSNVEDLAAILDRSGATDVFGVSSGAVVALEAALALPAIRRIALFEPAYFRGDRSRSRAALERIDRELDEGRPNAALVTGMKAGEMGPAAVRMLPRPILEWMVGQFVAAEERKPRGGYLTMAALAPTLPADFAVIAEAADNGITKFRDLGADVLLMGGSQSPKYLRDTLDDLEGLLSRAIRVEIPGVGHDAAWDSNRRGRPDLVAAELQRFFS